MAGQSRDGRESRQGGHAVGPPRDRVVSRLAPVATGGLHDRQESRQASLLGGGSSSVFFRLFLFISRAKFHYRPMEELAVVSRCLRVLLRVDFADRANFSKLFSHFGPFCALY